MKKLCLAIAMLVSLAGCGKQMEEPQSRPPSTIQDLHKDISGVYNIERDKATEIVIHQKNIWNAEAVLFSLISEATKITLDMRAHNLMPQTERVRFTTSIPLQDKYGNSTTERVLAITFLTSDINKINAQNKDFLPQDLVNLYEKVWRIHPVADEIIRKFCLADIGRPARVFCQAELIR